VSRIGKKAVAIPSGVTANVEGQTVKVKGPKGALQLVLHDDVTVKMDKGEIKVDPRSQTKRARSQWGTYRTLVANLMTGVTKGFEENLEITGVGFRAAVQGKNLQLQLGYSHDVVYPIPEGITIATRLSPIRARASSMWANTSSARKARRSNGARDGNRQSENSTAQGRGA